MSWFILRTLLERLSELTHRSVNTLVTSYLSLSVCWTTAPYRSTLKTAECLQMSRGTAHKGKLKWNSDNTKDAFVPMSRD
ncbi:hypothetical protein CAEBREN_02685 [Caenorhabditis brenneri]|uniref:Uncharacterized protein n=1 Tax=Caenorhabditis brenneri TaxID=135651 RepID=G0P0K6_CAEBE|nr:hypothetical protein CAEBREN_02685 [Caenorhabditis brenneri]